MTTKSAILLALQTSSGSAVDISLSSSRIFMNEIMAFWNMCRPARIERAAFRIPVYTASASVVNVTSRASPGSSFQRPDKRANYGMLRTLFYLTNR